jgi:3',5'-cyclic AMP phosphodiesterase CpdA
LWRPQFALPEDGPEGLAETAYSFDYQGARVIVLNSAESTRFAEQAAWLESRLKDNRNRWTIVAFHHPVFSVAGDRDNPALREAWKPLFDKYGVDLVLTGHDHTYGRGENLIDGGPRRDDAGTVYVVSVSGPSMNEVGKERTWATRTGANLQLYQVVTVSSQSLRLEARTITGQLFDAFEITKSRTGRRRFVDRKPEIAGTY